MNKKLGKIPGYLGIYMMTGFIILTFVVAFHDIPTGRMGLLDKMIIAYITMLAPVVTFHFNKNTTNSPASPPTEFKS